MTNILKLNNEALKYELDYKLSLESEVDLQSLFSDYFPKLTMNLREGYEWLINAKVETKISNDVSQFTKLVNKFDYIDLGPYRFNVPEGMEVDYLTYTNVLVKAVDLVKSMEADSLKVVERHLARLVNEDLLTFNANGFEKDLLERQSKVEEVKREILQVTNKGNEEQFNVYENVINRNGDWEAVFNNIKEMDLLNKKDLEVIKIRKSNIVELVDTVQDKINVTKSINKKVIKYTNDIVFFAAEEIKFISQIYYLVQNLLVSLNMGMRRFIKTYS